jgi:class 3 adenylate cyclase/tetratricopeptide (TPR) repeat protein
VPVLLEDSQAQRSPANDSEVSAVHRLGPQEYIRQLVHGSKRLLSERRIITTLFADIVDSTSLAERQDPEDVTTIMNSAFEALTKPVTRYEGTMARLMGDGVLCLFGAPTAHEDDALRACLAALEIVEGMRQLSEQLQVRYSLSSFAVRVGVSTGLAVVGEVGTEVRAEYTAMGDSVNLASRLQRQAKPDSILICEKTWENVKHSFEAEDAGYLEIKGKATPVRGYRLLRRMKQSTGDYTFAPLVGRELELGQLEKLIRDLRQNRGAILCISGEAGIGKSRLLREARLITDGEIKWADARCHSYTSEISYWAARGILRSLIGIDELTPPKTAVQQLRQITEQTSVPSGRAEPRSQTGTQPTPDLLALASLSYLLHLPLTPEEQAFIDSRKGQLLQQDIQSAYYRQVRSAAVANPLVLVWEDVHWIDPPSFQVLEALFSLCLEVPLLLVLTSRPEPGLVRDLMMKWRDDSHRRFREIQLSALDAKTSTTLLQHLFNDATIAEEALKSVLSIAGGNPFFLEEMSRALAETRQDRSSPSDELPADALVEFMVPRSVQAAVLSRVDRLSFRHKRVLQIASVVGRTFMREVLRKTVEPEMDTDQLDYALRMLEKRNYVECAPLQVEAHQPDSSAASNPIRTMQVNQSGCSNWAKGRRACISDQQIAFRHAITAEVVYQSLLKSERKRLHQRGGESIEELFVDCIDEVVPSLAYHFIRGTDSAKAGEYLCRTGNQSVEVFALDRAHKCYSKALQLAESNKQNISDSTLLRRINEGLGDIHYFSSEYQLALDHYDKSLQTEGNSRRQATLFRKKGRVFEKWGHHDRARECFEHGLDTMKSDFDEKEAGRIYAGLCMSYLHSGDLDTADELGRLALLLNQEAQDKMGIAEAHNNLGMVLIRKKDWEGAWKHYKQSRKIYERIGDRYGLASCYNNMGVLATNQADWRLALKCFHRSLGFFKELKNQHGMARVYDNLCQVFHRQGDSKRADRYLAKAVKILADISADHSGLHAELWQSGVW